MVSRLGFPAVKVPARPRAALDGTKGSGHGRVGDRAIRAAEADAVDAGVGLRGEGREAGCSLANSELANWTVAATGPSLVNSASERNSRPNARLDRSRPSAGTAVWPVPEPKWTPEVAVFPPKVALTSVTVPLRLKTAPPSPAPPPWPLSWLPPLPARQPPGPPPCAGLLAPPPPPKPPSRRRRCHSTGPRAEIATGGPHVGILYAAAAVSIGVARTRGAAEVAAAADRAGRHAAVVPVVGLPDSAATRSATVKRPGTRPVSLAITRPKSTGPHERCIASTSRGP